MTPVPNPADRCENCPAIPGRLAMQAAVFACYLMVAIALVFSAYRISATTELIDRIISEQSRIIDEVRDVKRVVPAEIKAAVKEKLK